MRIITTMRDDRLEVAGHRLECVGRWPRVARLSDEVWQEPPRPEISDLIAAARGSRLRADLVTVAQDITAPEPRHAAFPLTWDSVAVADATDFGSWWEALPQESRKHVRRSRKAGVVVRPAPFDHDLVAGIKRLYDETPVRQGRRFPHHGKELATVRRENSSYLARSHFLGAYLGETLIGFVKLVRVGPAARIMQILAAQAHRDVFPTQALLAAAVELCPKLPVRHLIYGQYIYGRKDRSPMTEFKRRNGFRDIRVPRYHVPLNWRGRLALSTGFHRPSGDRLPEPIVNVFLRLRSLALAVRPPRPAV
jgi:hypothetical protein